MPTKHCGNNIWLVKPANENQGKGIKIFNKTADITRFIETSLQFSHWVIQKYLERPLLYKARKFDIRVWCLAHSCGDFYFYETGYLRTTSSEYKLEEMQSFSDMSHWNRHLIDPEAE
jgi:tubulin---tyrosine ligase